MLAVYDADKRMKDVYLERDIVVPANGETITITTDTLDYAEGNTVKLFVFDSIGTIKPVNMYK